MQLLSSFVHFFCSDFEFRYSFSVVMASSSLPQIQTSTERQPVSDSRFTCHAPLTTDTMIRPVFTLHLNYKILPGLVTIGKYDGTHPCLTAATTADKVLIHSPHRKTAESTGRLIWSESNREIAILNINQAITCLRAGLFVPNDEKDILVIGTATHILVYHVHDNRDIFYKECPDAVKAVALGTFNGSKYPIVFVGGNSSVYGYDQNGTEVFWTAIGDAVTDIVLLDFNKDLQNELIISSEDFNIRVYKGNNMIAEHTETEIVTALAQLPENRFAYAVSNGTIGVYEQDVRLWRIKSKNFPISIHCYDLLGYGTPQLITGWSNGKVDCRAIKTGEVLFKDSLAQSTAGIVDGDYRSNGKADLICVSVEGEVRGYITTKTLTTPSGSGVEQDTVRDLLTQKQALMLELKHYENNSKFNDDYTRQVDSFDCNGVIPSNTRLQIAISANDENKKNNHVEIYMTTNNETIIKAALVFAEGIFKGETHVVHPANGKQRSDLSVQIYPPKDNPVDIHIKALVGFPTSLQFHVFEITRQLPRFSMYTLIAPTSPLHSVTSVNVTTSTPTGSHVLFKVNERIPRICMWINQNFLLPHDLDAQYATAGGELRIELRCLRDNNELTMRFGQGGKVEIYTDSLLLAADLVQSLGSFLNLDILESVASFEKDENNLKDLMEKLSQIQDARMKLGTDIADRLSQIRALVVRVEDSRINSLTEMTKYYNELNILNKEMINGYNIRLLNYNEGVSTMKQINNIIQKASRLRVGKKSAILIANCRTAIKNNNMIGLINVIRTGEM